MAAVLFLAPFALYHLYLVLRNRTTVGDREEERRYDVGVAANWRQVFGRRPLLWLLPVDGEQDCDGIHWPENPAWVADADGAAACASECV